MFGGHLALPLDAAKRQTKSICGEGGKPKVIGFRRRKQYWVRTWSQCYGFWSAMNGQAFYCLLNNVGKQLLCLSHSSS